MPNPTVQLSDAHRPRRGGKGHPQIASNPAKRKESVTGEFFTAWSSQRNPM